MLSGSQRRLLEDIERGLLDVQRRRLATLHDRLLGRSGSDPALFDAEEAELLGRPDYVALLDEESFADAGAISDAGSASDPPDAGALEARRLDLHRRRRREALLRTDPEAADLVRSLQGRHLDFRPFLGDAPADWVDIREALRTDPDEARREALWFAATPLAAAIESDVQRLFARRQALAAALDDTTFPALVLSTGEFSVLEYLALGDELEQATREPYEELLAWMRAEKDAATIEPWDVDFFLARLEPSPGALPAASFDADLDALLTRWGLSRSGLPIRVDESALPYGGLTLPVSIPDDVRVLVQPRDGLPQLESWWHEMGHALHMTHVRAEPAFRADAPAWDEAMAFLLERAGVTAATASAGAAKPSTGRGETPHGPTARAVVRLRQLLATSLFEILAYERPEGDLHGLYSEIQESYLGFPRHPERLWPARALFVTHPVYLPNYVLGRLAAAQLEELQDDTARWGERLARDIWGPGAVRPWTERIERLTGRPLDPDAYLRGLGLA